MQDYWIKIITPPCLPPGEVSFSVLDTGIQDVIYCHSTEEYLQKINASQEYWEIDLMLCLSKSQITNILKRQQRSRKHNEALNHMGTQKMLSLSSMTIGLWIESLECSKENNESECQVTIVALTFAMEWMTFEMCPTCYLHVVLIVIFLLFLLSSVNEWERRLLFTLDQQSFFWVATNTAAAFFLRKLCNLAQRRK